MKADIIRFDDEKFLKLYSLPAEPLEGNEKAKFIYKALEVYNNLKGKRNEKRFHK